EAGVVRQVLVGTCAEQVGGGQFDPQVLFRGEVKQGVECLLAGAGGKRGEVIENDGDCGVCELLERGEQVVRPEQYLYMPVQRADELLQRGQLVQARPVGGERIEPDAAHALPVHHLQL